MRELTCGLIANGRTFGLEECARSVNSIASGLRRSGLREGDRIAVIARNDLESTQTILGLINARMVAVPINPKLPVAAQRDLLSKFQCQGVFGFTGERADLREVALLSFHDLNGAGADESTIDDLVGDRPAVIIATSGSTGEPKGALLTTENLFSSAIGSNENIPFGRGDKWLLSLPLSHVGGLGVLFRAVVGGGTVVIPDGRETIYESCIRYGVTHLSLVANQLIQLLDQMESKNLRFPDCKAILLGGSAIPEPLIERSVKHRLPLYTSYGLTEMASQVTTTACGDSVIRLKTSGRILSSRELKIDSTGEILVRGRTLFTGYVTGSGIDRPVDTDGWFRTGDIGRLDADGYLVVCGRRDNMFISGGENIHPEEIEGVIRACVGVEDVLVVPVQSVQWGDRPAAFIRMKGGAPIDISLLKDTMSEQLPKYKFPEFFFDWPDEVQPGLKPSRPYFAALARELVRKTR